MSDLRTRASPLGLPIRSSPSGTNAREPPGVLSKPYTADLTTILRDAAPVRMRLPSVRRGFKRSALWFNRPCVRIRIQPGPRAYVLAGHAAHGLEGALGLRRRVVQSLLLTSCRVLVLNYDYIAVDRGRTNGPIPSGYHVGVSLLNKACLMTTIDRITFAGDMHPASAVRAVRLRLAEAATTAALAQQYSCLERQIVQEWHANYAATHEARTIAPQRAIVALMATPFPNTSASPTSALLSSRFAASACRSRQRVLESCRTAASYYTCLCAPVALVDCVRTVMPPAMARRP
ncbi:hypothetical protein C8Q74DRAFT_1369130 [Fomes fomentarius]|nr:hypothetical protein C8Q74DRAFT_1369130 [Fomes fomentarius]